MAGRVGDVVCVVNPGVKAAASGERDGASGGGDAALGLLHSPGGIGDGEAPRPLLKTVEAAGEQLEKIADEQARWGGQGFDTEYCLIRIRLPMIKAFLVVEVYISPHKLSVV